MSSNRDTRYEPADPAQPSPAVADTTLADLDAMAHDRSVDIRVRLAAVQALEAIRHATEVAAAFSIKPIERAHE